MTIWDDLHAHRAATEDRRITELFDADPDRFAAFSARLGDMLFDYSKTSIDATARELLIRLADETGVEERRDLMFSGAKINESEDRAVLHTALRRRGDGAVRGPDPGRAWCLLPADGADRMHR